MVPGQTGTQITTAPKQYHTSWFTLKQLYYHENPEHSSAPSKAYSVYGDHYITNTKSQVIQTSLFTAISE